MGKFLTVAEFEAMVRERVKPPAKVKHPPMTAAQRRAADRKDRANRQRAAARKTTEVL